MMVEMLVRWTEVQVKTEDEENLKLRRLLDGEDAPRKMVYKYDYAPMTFKMEDVRAFNRANDTECTTVRFYDEQVSVVKCPYNRFQEVYVEATGNTIASYLPEGYIDNPKKGAPPELHDMDDLDII